jgi:hypothetical protein
MSLQQAPCDRSYWVAVLLSVACATILTGASSCDSNLASPATTPPAAAHLFYGRVEDQNGNPVVGAEIAASSGELVMLRGGSAGVVRRFETQQKYLTQSDAQGAFLIRVATGHNDLSIDGVSKPAFEWLFDLAWTLNTPDKTSDNRYYHLRGGLVECPYYEPDPSRPAIFPMHATGAGGSPGRPSRGGRDMGCDRKSTTNDRVDVAIPTTGPGAPRTPEEVDQRLQAWAKARLK